MIQQLFGILSLRKTAEEIFNWILNEINNAGCLAEALRDALIDEISFSELSGELDILVEKFKESKK